MNNPDLYIILQPETPRHDMFSNLPWGKDEALRLAECSGKTQVIYKLVPVYRVGVNVVREFYKQEL